MKKISLSRNDLKLIAIVAMTIDHITWTFFPGYNQNIFVLMLHLIGRLTAPIMCFFVAEGYHYTKNFKSYAKRLFALAVISHFAYCFCFALSYVPFRYTFFNGTGIVWSLFFGLLMLRLNDNKNFSEFQKLIIILLCCVITFPSDWSCVAMMMVFFIGANRGSFKVQMTYMVLMTAIYSVVYFVFLDKLYGILQMGTILSIPLLARYNGEKGKQAVSNKLFYIYYPAHLFVLGLVRVFLEMVGYY